MKNGTPRLYINGREECAMAYTTYFEERSRYTDFIKAGYRIFFVNVSFTTAPINSVTGFTPFNVGVFEDPETPDYSELECAVHKILDACPDAIIFPRINVSMPKRWVDSHPEDVVATENGGYREALFSPAFRKDGGEMLKELIRHVRSSDYESRIGGWQICGGMTQEWFHHDYKGSLGKAAEKPYRKFIKETYGTDGAVLPKKEELQYKGVAFNECENARRYSLFANLGVAESLDHFAAVIKKETENEQVVGAFYGYSFESNHSVVFGTHALRALIDSPNLDFFSSPNAYAENRRFGIDWADMIPVDSVREHGKLCFIECDIRTYLTCSIQEARPGVYPDGIYKTENGKSVWSGPPTPELSREALRKSFAHQITRGSAIWWFDMWGGWYNDSLLMEELSRMRSIFEKRGDLDNAPLSPEVAFFADERGYSNLLSGSPQLPAITETRTAMGNTGVPYDTYAVEDADAVLKKYKAAVFVMPIPSEAGAHAIGLCEKLGIPYLTASADHPALTVSELRALYKRSGAHFYTDEEDVVYLGGGYIGLHSDRGGKKVLRLPSTRRITSVFGADIGVTESELIEFEQKDNATALFSIS